MELGTWVGVDRAHPSPFASLGLAGGLKSTHHGDRNESSSQDPSLLSLWLSITMATKTQR